MEKFCKKKKDFLLISIEQRNAPQEKKRMESKKMDSITTMKDNDQMIKKLERLLGDKDFLAFQFVSESLLGWPQYNCEKDDFQLFADQLVEWYSFPTNRYQMQRITTSSSANFTTSIIWRHFKEMYIDNVKGRPEVVALAAKFKIIYYQNPMLPREPLYYVWAKSNITSFVYEQACFKSKLDHVIHYLRWSARKIRRFGTFEDYKDFKAKLCDIDIDALYSYYLKKRFIDYDPALSKKIVN